jgi:predicted nucleic acid-binding protein
MVDANVIVNGVLWPRWPYEVLQHTVRGDYQLVLSPHIIKEARIAIAKIVPTQFDAIDKLLDTVDYEEAPNPTEEEILAAADLVRDPKDVHVALAAINAEVDFLLTRDRDFTDRDETTRELHQRLNILLPGTFLRQYMGWTSEALEAIRHRTWGDF